MTTYTDVFGVSTVPPADSSFIALGVTTNITLAWPYNSSGADSTAKIMELTAGSAGLSVTLPPANEVSVGEDVLMRNTGAYDITLKDNAGGTVATLAPSTAKYLYLTANSTAAGTWSVLAFGSGASAVDAATLVGYGLTAISTTLNSAHSVFPTATGMTVTSIHRSRLINYTGGAGTLALTAASTLGDNFFVLVRNSGTGTLTIDPDGSEIIDGSATMSLNPGESAMLVTSGVAWFTIGLGRSLQYNFTQLVKDVSAAGTFTLSAAEASNKLLRFIGNPSSGATIIVPNVVSVYYVYSDISTAQNVVVKTLAGAGVTLAQSERVVAICDSTDVVAAQAAATSSVISFTDGSVTNPSVNFTTQTNTGLFKYGTYGVGIAVNGVEAAHCDYSGGVGKIYNASSEELASQVYVQAAIAAAKPAVMPVGATTLFYANTAPTGWTKLTTSALDNAALRIVSDGSGSGGNGGVTGGTSTFAAVFNGTWSGNSYTLTVTDMPSHNHGGATGGQSASHTHGYTDRTVYDSGLRGGSGSNAFYYPTSTSDSTGAASNDHTHSISSQGGGGGHAHGNTLDVRYASFIVASRNAY